MGTSSNSQHAWDYISTVPSLVPRPLREILSRSRGEKSGEGLGLLVRKWWTRLVQSESTLRTLQDKIWEWPGDEAIMCHLPAPASIQQYFDY